MVDGASVASYEIDWRHVTPSFLLIIVGLMCSFVTVVNWRTSERMTLIRTAQACIAGALFFAFLLIAVPLVTREQPIALLLSAIRSVGGSWRNRDSAR